MKYQVIFRTPAGVIAANVKEGSLEDIEAKKQYYLDEENLLLGVCVTSNNSQILIPGNVLVNSLIEFNFDV